MSVALASVGAQLSVGAQGTTRAACAPSTRAASEPPVPPAAGAAVITTGAVMATGAVVEEEEAAESAGVPRSLCCFRCNCLLADFRSESEII